jgi:hypothetical protein
VAKTMTIMPARISVRLLSLADRMILESEFQVLLLSTTTTQKPMKEGSY